MEEWTHATQHLPIVGGILMEATNTADEIGWLLELATELKGTWGVIGWIDLDRGTVLRSIQRYAKHDAFKGVRLNWLTPRECKALRKGIEKLTSLGKVIDILPAFDQLPAIHRFVRDFPDTTFVLEHFGAISLQAEFFSAWQLQMSALAQLPQVSLKLSGFRAAHTPEDIALFHRYCDTALALFGTERLLFGSNYPIGQQSNTYSDTLATFMTWLCTQSVEVREAVLSGNARGIYGL
jgi:L-fuconolactonase